MSFTSIHLLLKSTETYLQTISLFSIHSTLKILAGEKGRGEGGGGGGGGGEGPQGERWKKINQCLVQDSGLRDRCSVLF